MHQFTIKIINFMNVNVRLAITENMLLVNAKNVVIIVLVALIHNVKTVQKDIKPVVNSA